MHCLMPMLQRQRNWKNSEAKKAAEENVKKVAAELEAAIKDAGDVNASTVQTAKEKADAAQKDADDAQKKLDDAKKEAESAVEQAKKEVSDLETEKQQADQDMIRQ